MSLIAVLLVVLCKLSHVDQVSASQETGTIFGTLVDGSVPIPNAIIEIPKLWIAEQTAGDGTFRLSTVMANGFPWRPCVTHSRTR
jgi:hypothetical protein